MGAYDNYKIITDNSAADFQNTVAKHVDQGFKRLDANAEQRRKIKEQLKVENHRRNANQIKYNNADSNAAFEFGQAFKGPDNQFSDSLNESFSSTLSMINSLKVQLDDKNITPKDALEAQEQLVIQNNVLNSIKDEQSTYIGTSGAAKEKVKDTAGLDTSYSYTGVGEDNDEDAAQDIYNNLAGNPVAEGNSLVRNPDSSVTAKGTYSSNEEGGEGTKYNVEFSPSEWKKFSEKPTYDLLNSAVAAVSNITPGLFTSDGKLDPLMVQNKPADAKEMEKIQSLDITTEEKANKISDLTTTYGTETTVDTIIPGDNPKIQTEIRKSLSQDYIKSLVDPEILSQTNGFKVSTKAQQLKQLTALGLPENEWEKYSSSDIETTTKFWKKFDEALKEDVNEGLMRANPKFKKDKNEDWYFSSNIKTKDAPSATEKQTTTKSVIDLDIIENFNTEGEIELKDFGLNDNTRLIYGSGMKEPEDISFDNNVITVTFKKPEGIEGSDGYEPGIVNTFDVSTNLGRKNIIDRLGLNQESEITLKKLLENKYKKVEELEKRKDKFNTTDGKPMDGGGTNARLTAEQEEDLKKKVANNKAIEENKKLQEQMDKLQR